MPVAEALPIAKQIAVAGLHRRRHSPPLVPHGKGIFFVGPGERLMAAEVSARGDTLEVDRPQPLFEVRRQRPGNVFDVTPDGQRFLVNTFSETQTPRP
jgi:hypothetical protein